MGSDHCPIGLHLRLLEVDQEAENRIEETKAHMAEDESKIIKRKPKA